MTSPGNPAPEGEQLKWLCPQCGAEQLVDIARVEYCHATPGAAYWIGCQQCGTCQDDSQELWDVLQYARTQARLIANAESTAESQTVNYGNAMGSVDPDGAKVLVLYCPDDGTEIRLRMPDLLRAVANDLPMGTPPCPRCGFTVLMTNKERTLFRALWQELPSYDGYVTVDGQSSKNARFN